MKTEIPLPIVQLLGKKAVIEDKIDFNIACEKKLEFKAVPTSELYSDELSAQLYKLGNFTIRRSYVACKTYPNYYPSREPVEAELFQKLRSEIPDDVRLIWNFQDKCYTLYDCRIQTVFSINYKYICHAQETGRSWVEGVTNIYLAKENSRSSKSDALCIIKKIWTGSQSSSEDWYAVFPDGSVKLCHISGYDEGKSEWISERDIQSVKEG